MRIIFGKQNPHEESSNSQRTLESHQKRYHRECQGKRWYREEEKKPWVTEEIIRNIDERRKWKRVNTDERKREYRTQNIILRRTTDRARQK